ncbi:Molybdenum transport system permease protein ModB [Pseudobythopirellula maris]|uniref:Molybdenum transport system permease n=1 Tax=Pseudobythopirellula maris TaxID=2527991 RepID=A0A5C5ZSR2_9BACT|nr:molybdate ABC transporter permease subunit [Pseudobythopirellula maris]TWT89811.1 Molybdenum transport system permease protein ModB [Pseudobythopirellula maris]
MLSPEEWSALALSLQVGVCAVLMSLPLAILVGYVLARTNFAGRWALQGLVDLPLVLPPVVTGYLLLVLLGPRGPVGSWLEGQLGVRVAFAWLGAAVASAVVSFPLMVRAIRGAFLGVDPRLETAARGLGASPVRAFFTVALPMARHGVVAGCLLAFARSVGEFGATIMLAGDIPGETRTLPLAIYSHANRVGGMQQSWRLVLLSVLLAAAALAVGEFLERGRLDGQRRGTT